MTRTALPRCAWAASDPLLQTYHDTEWGIPERDPRALWELLMLEGFQAGLAWITILRKRDAFRTAFAGFDPAIVAGFTEADVARLLQNAGIVRSRAKIEATIGGARATLAMQRAGTDLSRFAWAMADAEPPRLPGPIPARSDLSVRMSVALKARGFKFVGPVIVYSWMQAAGMVDDHEAACFRHGRPR